MWTTHIHTQIVRRMSSVGRSTHPTPATPPARAHQHDDIHTQAPLTFPTKSARHDTHTFTHNEDDDEGDDGDAVAAVLDSEGGNDAHGIKEQVQYEIKEHALVQHDKVDDHTIQQQQQQQQKQQQQLQPSKSTPQSDHTQPSSHQHQPTTAPESPQSPQPEPPQADTFDLSRVSLRTQDAYHTAATFVYGRQLSMRLSKPNLGRGQQFGQQPSTPTGSPYGTSPHAGWASGNTMSPATSLLPPMPVCFFVCVFLLIGVFLLRMGVFVSCIYVCVYMCGGFLVWFMSMHSQPYHAHHITAVLHTITLLYNTITLLLSTLPSPTYPYIILTPPPPPPTHTHTARVPHVGPHRGCTPHHQYHHRHWHSLSSPHLSKPCTTGPWCVSPTPLKLPTNIPAACWTIPSCTIPSTPQNNSTHPWWWCIRPLNGG